jgi:hypothetical protein
MILLPQSASTTALRSASASRNLTEFSDAELIAMLGTAVDLHDTKAIHEKPSKTDVRGFLELVAGGEYRPKQ